MGKKLVMQKSKIILDESQYVNRVFASIDYYSGQFYNVSIDFVIRDFLKMDFNPFSDPTFYENLQRVIIGKDSNVRIEYEGIVLFLRNYELLHYLSLDKELNLMDVKFSSIKLDVTGHGMRFMRAINEGIESYLRSCITLDNFDVSEDASFHLTRCDFAFDFINYKSDFYSKVQDHLIERSRAGYINVPVLSSKRPLNFDLKTGKNEVIYVGGNQCLLRIYDKLLESKMDISKLPEQLPDGEHVESWIRLEWQLREEWASRIFYGVGDKLNVLKNLYEKYSFVDDQRHVVDFWVTLFEWERLPHVIQNLHYIRPKLNRDKIIAAKDQKINGVLPYVLSTSSGYWMDSVIEELNNALFRLQDNPGSYAWLNVLHKACCLFNCPFDENDKPIRALTHLLENPNLVLGFREDPVTGESVRAIRLASREEYIARFNSLMSDPDQVTIDVDVLEEMFNLESVDGN